MITKDLTNLSLSEAVSLLNKGTVTSYDLTLSCLESIYKNEEQINSHIFYDASKMLQEAQRADKKRRKNSNQMLLGIPLAHKDMFYRKGEISTCGSPIMAEQIQEVTATVIKRLDDAGALDIGKLNMSEFAAGPTGHNTHFGDVHNPWNLGYIPGGSSSGSAAAVAAGFCFGSLGSDTGASIDRKSVV